MSKTTGGEFTPRRCSEVSRVLDESEILKEELQDGLGGRLSKHLRGHKSVRAFARECGVSPTYISLIENDLSRGSFGFLRRLIDKVPTLAPRAPRNRKKS